MRRSKIKNQRMVTSVKRLDREVLTLADLTDKDVAEIMKARVRAKYKHLDKELKGWKP